MAKKNTTMIYRLTASNTDGFTMIVDYNKKQDAIDKKLQFERWDTLKPETAPHTVNIYEIPEPLYNKLMEKEHQGKYKYNDVMTKIKDYAI